MHRTRTADRCCVAHLYDAYPLDDIQKKRIEAYSAELESTIGRAVGEAIANLAPATLADRTWRDRFCRQSPQQPGAGRPGACRKHALRGPVDHSVPVLAVRSPEGKLVAAVFAYACHNTTLSIYEWSGDYAGFAATNLETTHPGAVALFAMGCGADQNPVPRRKVEQCRKYGRMMSDAVEAVLSRPMESLNPGLRTEFQIVTLTLGAAPTRGELKPLAAGRPGYIQRWASRLLKEMDAGQPLARTYPYPIEVWQLGGRQLWIALGGEVVVDYDLRFKDRYGAKTWVTSYCNDVMAYIPSLRVLREGGYEGNTSMIVYGMPAQRWAEDIEETIATAVDRAVRRVEAEK